MAVLRTEIEKALDEIISQEEGMRFQGLAVVLGKKHWPELLSRQRKKDEGLDAYAPKSDTPEKVGKGLAASITATLTKVSSDAKTAKKNFPDLKALLFVTAAKVGNAAQKEWKATILKDYDLDLLIIEREEIITQMMMPENRSLCSSFLHLHVDVEPDAGDLIDRTRRAADAVTRTWANKTKGSPLIELTAMRLEPRGAEPPDVLTLTQIEHGLSQGQRVTIEGPAGRGKTTTLIQLAQRHGATGIAFIVELPLWVSSSNGLLEYIALMPAVLAEGLTAADLARVQQMEPFVLLLNGWNEIAESNSTRANNALRTLEREFPSAGILVATRTHHLIPPLPGATLRLRLRPLQHTQRTAYLAERLGANGNQLSTRLDADPSLDELTQTPFVLAEVASLYEQGAEIPSTKFGVLAAVRRLHEQRDEHRNALAAAPIFGEQTLYLQALAAEMTRLGAVALPQTAARAVVAAVVQDLVSRHQIESAGAPTVIATLTAHHVLERVDYPQTAFQFEHQLLQEYYAALHLHARLANLTDDNNDARIRFTNQYVDDTKWAETLRITAGALAEEKSSSELAAQNTRAGRQLVEMALTVDIVFAAELARLCGVAIWDKVHASVSERLRVVYASDDANYREYALCAMLATGASDFTDIVVPLLAADDQQTRLHTYRLWHDLHVSSLGSNWRGVVQAWPDETRSDFVYELLDHRLDVEVVSFAVDDSCRAVKEAAASALLWTGFDDALTRVLQSMDRATFSDVARRHVNQIPATLLPSAIAALRDFVGNTAASDVRLQAALDLIALGEIGLDGVVKDTLAVLRSNDIRKLGHHLLHSALEYLHKADAAWTSDWLAVQIAEGALYEHAQWLRFATATSNALVDKYLAQLESVTAKNSRGAIAVIAACGDASIAARIFAKLRELRHRTEASPGKAQELERQAVRNLESVLRSLPDDATVEGILATVSKDDPLDITVASSVLSRNAMTDAVPLQLEDDDLHARLREYLKSGVDLMLRRDDFNGDEKADLASAIAQVGSSEDIAVVVRLIQADIERMRHDRDTAGGSNCITSHARWYLAAVAQLDAVGAEQVLIDLLPSPEYTSQVASRMAHEFVPKPQGLLDRSLQYDAVWEAREFRPLTNEPRRARFAAALNSEIQRLRAQCQDGKTTPVLRQLAKSLAAIGGRDSAVAVLDVIAMPGRWDQHDRLETTERLLMAGVSVPATIVFGLVDSAFKRAQHSSHESDRHLLCRVLALCPFVDDPMTGIAKIREVIGKWQLRGNELAELIVALGESRSDAAFDLLHELASNAQSPEACENHFITAFATLDTPRARELLVGLVDPSYRGFALPHRLRSHSALTAALTELAGRSSDVARHLRALCEGDQPDFNREVLSSVMARLGTPEALTANLTLLDDAKPSAIPKGIWNQLEIAFLERQPDAQNSNVFTVGPRASNELRARLFRMAVRDEKRKKSAVRLLGRIEAWRLEHGRPPGEPRHPDVASGYPWPLFFETPEVLNENDRPASTV